ncbi:MAG: hypothetical protein K9I82_17975 [Chitinophagaceae bacterium]|nr:hypothetical protein [Chitinophagaceae bacterium]
MEHESTTNQLKIKSYSFFPVRITLGSDFRERVVIPIGFEPMTYSLEGCRSIQQNNRKHTDSLLKYPQWATDKATFRRSCLKIQITKESGQMPAFCFYKSIGYKLK